MLDVGNNLGNRKSYILGKAKKHQIDASPLLFEGPRC